MGARTAMTTPSSMTCMARNPATSSRGSTMATTPDAMRKLSTESIHMIATCEVIYRV